MPLVCAADNRTQLQFNSPSHQRGDLHCIPGIVSVAKQHTENVVAQALRRDGVLRRHSCHAPLKPRFRLSGCMAAEGGGKMSCMMESIDIGRSG
jgi:hypothetical protein